MEPHDRTADYDAPRRSADDVRAFLRRSAYPNLADYVAELADEVVTLAGVAPSFHAKQMAQNIAARCPGVGRVINQIRVEYARPAAALLAYCG